jgi:subtilisin family serine protease
VFDTQEYQGSPAAWQALATGAYDKGASGKNVIVAVIDSGFASVISPFAGRVHPASKDMVGSRGLDGPNHHGTAVASILGAAKDDAGIHGVAFDATLLMLRTDIEGTCSPNCTFDQSALADAFDFAVQTGARVIVLSMSFIPMPASLAAAVARATAAGVVVILPAGNDGLPNPVASAMIATTAEAQGAVIIAGGSNSAGTDLASFSNRAGSGANFYLMAAGEGLRVYGKNGALSSPTAWGTSLSAPAIGGAVALLAQAYPNLTGKQIVNLLLTSATDVGVPGTDAVYGRGKLNLSAAFVMAQAAATPGN